MKHLLRESKDGIAKTEFWKPKSTERAFGGSGWQRIGYVDSGIAGPRRTTGTHQGRRDTDRAARLGRDPG